MKYLLPYQRRWIEDQSPLKIIEKSRQIGLTFADASDSVIKAGLNLRPMDVWVSSRDVPTAKLYLLKCKTWARCYNLLTQDLGEQIIDERKDIRAFVLKFSTNRCIYSLSSSPDALVSRTGHVKLDEFAIHKDQRELLRVSLPCINWGGQLSIISTHRGVDSVFNELIRTIKEEGNPMSWSHHRVTLQDAVDQGLVARINHATGKQESPEHFVNRLRASCLDEEQWLREYCCIPSDENTAFLTWDLIRPCQTPRCLQALSYLETCPNPLYVGVDVARKQHLCVIDVGEKIGDVMWDRLRLELTNASFSEIESELYRILHLPKVYRACIDATGLGMQLAERAKYRFGWKVEPITFTASIKEYLAFGLRAAFEDRRLRIDPDPKLLADLRGVRKEITVGGHIRFAGETNDSHCDRFWAKALRQHASGTGKRVGALLAI